MGRIYRRIGINVLWAGHARDKNGKVPGDAAGKWMIALDNLWVIAQTVISIRGTDASTVPRDVRAGVPEIDGDESTH